MRSYYRLRKGPTLPDSRRTMASPSMSVSMANHWNSWFNFQSGKQASSTLLEANVAAQSAGMHGSVPVEADDQSISGASRLSAASTTSLRASFADQQQQPLEQMCAPIDRSATLPLICLIWPPPPRIAVFLSPPPPPRRRFFVPSRDDLARDELEAVMAEDGEDEGDEENLMFQDEEEHDEEASLRAWMRIQQEAARKTWGVKGEVGLAEYRRRQVQRWQHAQHAHDDEMLDLAFSQLLTRASSSFEGLFYSPPADATLAPSVILGGARSPPRVRPVRTHGWIDL